MALLRRIGAVYLVGVAVAVAVFFIVNTFLRDTLDVLQVWLALDVLMVIGLAAALLFNFSRKMEVGGLDPESGVTLRYLEVNVAFYATAAVAILFLHNWFFLLAGNSLELNNHQAWVIWAFVDTALPLTLGATGCAMWREAEKP